MNKENREIKIEATSLFLFQISYLSYLKENLIKIQLFLQ